MKLYIKIILSIIIFSMLFSWVEPVEEKLIGKWKLWKFGNERPNPDYEFISEFLSAEELISSVYRNGIIISEQKVKWELIEDKSSLILKITINDDNAPELIEQYSLMFITNDKIKLELISKKESNGRRLKPAILKRIKE